MPCSYFLFIYFFVVFPFPCAFSVFPFLFRFVVLRLFLVSPSSLFFSLPCSPRWRIMLFCLRATPPPRGACEPAYLRIPLVCCLLSFVLAVIYFVLFSSFNFFDFDLGVVLFHPVFLWVLWCLFGFGFGCDSFSIPGMTHDT